MQTRTSSSIPCSQRLPPGGTAEGEGSTCPAPRLTARAAASAGIALVALLAGILLPGCDNPACVFGGNCSGSSGGSTYIGPNPASFPVDGEWIAQNAPSVTSVFPNSMDADINTPVAVLFSESMSSQNLNIAFTLESTTTPIGFVPLVFPTLIGDGRLLVMFPATPLFANTDYTIKYREDVAFQDLTGQTVVIPTDRVAGTFHTATTPAAAPRVLMTFPPDAATNQSSTGEIDVVFDRAIDGASVNDGSFVVTVNGMAPTFDPVAQPLSVLIPPPDTRVYRYRSVDPVTQIPAPLLPGGSVMVSLSPAGNLIHDTTLPTPGNLANTMFDFTIASFSAPSSVAITSMPNDAIGIDQISGPTNLALQVMFTNAQSGDFLQLYLFGTKRQTETSPPRAALIREVALMPPFTSFTMTAAEIDLLLSSSPVEGRFQDGPMAFACDVRRGSQVSPVRMLDVDTSTAGLQHPQLDTVAPTLTGLSTSGTTVSTYRSNIRDLTVVGRTSEVLRSALVTTSMGDNNFTMDGFPPVAGARPVMGPPAGPLESLFVAASVPVAQLSAAQNPLSFTLTIYDRALNSAAPVTSSFRQLGASGPGSLTLGASITVEVFDATTLAPIESAQVFTHENVGGTVSLVSLVPGMTDANGIAIVPGGSTAGGQTVLTVLAAGYNLFTFDGLATVRIGVPLQPTVLDDAGVSGVVATSDMQLNIYTRSLADSRMPAIGETLVPVGVCSFDTTDLRYECPYGPTAIRSRVIGGESALAVLVPTSVFLYSALTFLKGYQLAFPIPPAAPGSSGTSTLVLPFLLDDGGLDPEERPVDAPAIAMSTVNYPMQSGPPRVRVEARAPGLPGTLTVGEGVAFDILPPSTDFIVRAAYPGSVDGIQDVPSDMKGRYVRSGTIDGDLMIRSELVASTGERGGSRPRLSTVPPPPAIPVMIVPPAAAALVGMPVVNAGLQALDITFTDVIPDVYAEPALYRVTLTDHSTPRLSWTIWRVDLPDLAGPDAIVHAPYVGLGGVLPLTGSVDCQISAFAWPSLNVRRFLWTDVEREYDLFSHGVASSFMPPP